MKKLLITGFDPFGGEAINPAWEAVKRLPDAVGEYQLVKLEIPTVYGEASRRVLFAAQESGADVILCVGQAGGRKAITPEMVGINLRHARIADNAGNQPEDMPVAENAPAAYFATVPVRRMAQAAEDAGIPASVSYSAGTFVCNDTLYAVLHHCAGTPVKAGFIHVPFLPQQAKEGVPSMPLEEMARGLAEMIAAI